MSIIATAIIGGGAAIFSGYEAEQGAKAQASALGQASQTVQQGQSNALAALKQYLGPYAQFGQSLLPTLQSLLTPGPSQTATLSQLPGFQFAKSIAGDLVSAGAGKTGISGTTAVQGGELGAQLASKYFSDFTDPLVSLYGQGQNAAGAIGQGAAGIYTRGAQSLAGLQVGQGNVQAGLASALGGAAGGLGNTLTNAMLYNKLAGALGGGGGAWGLHADSGGLYFGQ